MLEKVPEAELVIVGDGTDRRHLMDLVQALDIQQQVKFLILFPQGVICAAANTFHPPPTPLPQYPPNTQNLRISIDKDIEIAA